MVIGLVMHLGFSLAFGMGFALLAPILRRAPLLLLGGLLYGAAVYVLNFQILGRTVFPFFNSPKGPDQVFEFLIHLLYGLLLAPSSSVCGAATTAPLPLAGKSTAEYAILLRRRLPRSAGG